MASLRAMGFVALDSSLRLCLRKGYAGMTRFVESECLESLAWYGEDGPS